MIGQNHLAEISTEVIRLANIFMEQDVKPMYYESFTHDMSEIYWDVYQDKFESIQQIVDTINSKLDGMYRLDSSDWEIDTMIYLLEYLKKFCEVRYV